MALWLLRLGVTPRSAGPTHRWRCEGNSTRLAWSLPPRAKRATLLDPVRPGHVCAVLFRPLARSVNPSRARHATPAGESSSRRHSPSTISPRLAPATPCSDGDPLTMGTTRFAPQAGHCAGLWAYSYLVASYPARFEALRPRSRSRYTKKGVRFSHRRGANLAPRLFNVASFSPTAQIHRSIRPHCRATTRPAGWNPTRPVNQCIPSHTLRQAALFGRSRVHPGFGWRILLRPLAGGLRVSIVGGKTAAELACCQLCRFSRRFQAANRACKRLACAGKPQNRPIY